MTDNRTPSREALALANDLERTLNQATEMGSAIAMSVTQGRTIVELLRAERQTTPGAGVEDELASYEKFDGIGPHSETIETRARIGERYLEAYESALSDPRLNGYTPADCPSELLLDVLNTWFPPVDESSQVAGEDEYVGRYTCRSCSEPTDNDSDVCDACEQDAAALSKPQPTEGVEDWPFQRGDKIVKLKGHAFGNGDAEVVTCYQTKAGEWRVVGEHPEGWQFIFSPNQIALSNAQPASGDTTAGDEARLSYTSMASGGRCDWRQLREAVQEARVGCRETDHVPLGFPGHEMVPGINYNSLDRIVTAFVDAALKSRDNLAARLAVVEGDRDRLHALAKANNSLARMNSAHRDEWKNRAIAAEAAVEQAKGAMQEAIAFLGTMRQAIPDKAKAMQVLLQALASLGSPSEGVKS